MNLQIDEVKILDDCLLWMNEEYKDIFWPYFEGSEKQRKMLELRERTYKYLVDVGEYTDDDAEGVKLQLVK